MDTLKGQGNKVIMGLCKENFCHAVIIPHNKPAKSFTANKYNAWIATEVKGIKPADVKVLLALSELKPVHTHWIVGVYEYLCKQPEIIKNDFRAGGITEAVKLAHSPIQRIENPFISNL